MKYNRIAPSYEAVGRLWEGSVDMHTHPAPDAEVARRANGLEMAIAAQQAGMRAIVLKSFYYTTTCIQDAARLVAPDVKVFGSITISESLGGLSAKAVEEQAKMGCKVVWMPAFDAYYFCKGLGVAGGIPVLDDSGRLLPEVVDVIKVVKMYDMVLCSGHLCFDETVKVFEEANRQGVTKLIATHPLATTPCRMTMDQVHVLADMGAYIEHVYGNCFSRLGSLNPQIYVDAIKEIGAKRSILSTDFAQNTDPMPAEGMRMAIGTMLQYGCTEAEVEYLVKKNPYKLLDLE